MFTNDNHSLEEQVRTLFLTERQTFLSRTTGQTPNYQATLNAHYPHWDGGEDSRGINHKSIWTKITNFIQQHHLDPELLVRSTFDAHIDRPPYPTFLLSEKALVLYRSYKQNSKHRINTSLLVQFNSIRRQLSLLMLEGLPIEVAYRRVILLSDLTPLVAYCLARKTKQNDLAKLLQERARKQYSQDQEQYQDELLLPYLKEL